MAQYVLQPVGHDPYDATPVSGDPFAEQTLRDWATRHGLPLAPPPEQGPKYQYGEGQPPPSDLTEHGQVPAAPGWEGPVIDPDTLTGPLARSLLPPLSRVPNIPNLPTSNVAR